MKTLFLIIKFIRTKLQHRCFPMNIEKFLSPYFEKHLQTAVFTKSTLILPINQTFSVETTRPSQIKLCQYKFQ